MKRYSLFAVFFAACFVAVIFIFLRQGTVREAPVLRWAADLEGGAPYAFADPAKPSRVIGFEVEVVEALAKELGRKPVFVQNSWDGLIPGLKRGDYDIAINGIEITPDRQAEVLFSDPYYITCEQLTVRKDEERIHSLADCKGKVAGTLKVSLAQRILESAGGIEVKTYENEVNCYADLVNGRLDAVLMDIPIAVYYADPNPKLKPVGSVPIGRMDYGIAMRKEDGELGRQVNEALRRMAADGRLREILERWNLWNTMMADQLNDHSPSRTPPVAYQEFLKASGRSPTWTERLDRYVSFLPALGYGALMTLGLSVISMVLAILLGLALALTRLYGPRPAQWGASCFIELMRGTPLLLQLYLIYYGLPELGIRLSPFVAAVLGLGLNYAAYEAENYRAGLLAVPKGQMEAALALGMTRPQGLRHIVVPQALRIVLPPVTNDFISLLKDSSLVSTITMVELLKQYGKLSASYYDYVGTGILVAAIYLLLGLPFVRLARWTERKLAVETQAMVLGRR